MHGTVAFQFMRWWMRGLLVFIIDTLVLPGIIITVVNALQNVPKRKYISVIPPACCCDSFWSSWAEVNVKNRTPRDPSVVYVFTSSFIAPMNLNGLSVEQKKEFMHFRFSLVIENPPIWSPPCESAIDVDGVAL